MATVSAGTPGRLRVQRTAPVAPSSAEIEPPIAVMTEPSAATATCRSRLRTAPGTGTRQTGRHPGRPQPATAKAARNGPSGAYTWPRAMATSSIGEDGKLAVHWTLAVPGSCTTSLPPVDGSKAPYAATPSPVTTGDVTRALTDESERIAPSSESREARWIPRPDAA